MISDMQKWKSCEQWWRYNVIQLECLESMKYGSSSGKYHFAIFLYAANEHHMFCWIALFITAYLVLVILVIRTSNIKNMHLKNSLMTLSIFYKSKLNGNEWIFGVEF